ncbi:hypothetical protein SLNWT_0124 [Streptomyces albus]|uniref:Uncharacterized protein n=1 Tax=Streptomyces albus (strain ATCC 21838 / DSM 41398 / FERM P-419 / JCM 4703 / NBRC 107858) TaxID=1081613 RepID=A0A0B5EMC2_STRA4|nr:hypothetical protein SLNWT_0124 [Streptomyces albus]AOU74818.1 hypothetical protein SLNHY_0127 [Streptomyces albus]AYN30630.1 hypothetical protein DUI70_0127 [Streptomyces albus]
MDEDDEPGQGAFDLDIDLLKAIDLDSLTKERLSQLLEAGLRTRFALRKRPAPEPKIAHAVGLNTLQGADEHDLREAVHVLDAWLRAPAETPQPAQRSRFERPEGTGQIPAPRCLKKALIPRTCGLCHDPIKAGDDIGRFRQLKAPLEQAFVPMGWLCRHCLLDRRDRPRLCDLLLRFFHHVFAISAVGLNPAECALLHTRLDDTTVRKTAAWQRDPLDTTLVRLATSVAEDKPTTWIAYPTALTALRAIASGSTDHAEADLLADILQRIDEWEINSPDVNRRRYGTGIAYRQQVLRQTPQATFLSDLGGPFYLHKSVDPVDETVEDTGKPAQ